MFEDDLEELEESIVDDQYQIESDDEEAETDTPAKPRVPTSENLEESDDGFSY
jgi:hypothetical protein